MQLEKLLLLLAAVIICAASSHVLDQEWNTWRAKYEKEYATEQDELFRRQVWEATWHKVQKHNELANQGLSRYKMGMNKFADMTSEEHSSRSCVTSNKISVASKKSPVQTQAKNLNIPEAVDWRDSNCVGPVTNQGSYCGSCWAFATVGVVESHYCMKTRELIKMSEQQLVDCDGVNDGCCGGLPTDALEHISQKGLMKAKDYEYSEKKFICLYKPKKSIMVNVTKYYILPNENNMASSVAINGPITVLIDASEDLMGYTEGIFDGECTEETNHAVIVVGYGTEYDEDNDENVDYWIVKNSWGEEWGENGYIKMKRNINQCGIASMAVSVDLAD
ncbi:cathepsin L-like proteinase [Phyllobates terribilis]|uniref:cathepsin L-like proteinase n=1 Tax=Phyllobates terribilis TaxID=111132 RepID=UPI003CCADCEA